MMDADQIEALRQHAENLVNHVFAEVPTNRLEDEDYIYDELRGLGMAAWDARKFLRDLPA